MDRKCSKCGMIHRVHPVIKCSCGGFLEDLVVEKSPNLDRSGRAAGYVEFLEDRLRNAKELRKIARLKKSNMYDFWWGFESAISTALEEFNKKST